MDGRAIQSCDTPLWSAAGKDITTVEGLGLRLREAFLQEQAAQCGYCINGILMSASVLLSGNKTPSREDIAEALDRHLCRCGTHVRILRAIERAAGKP
jgi:nicotinate dehydrogenase subunit A